MKNLFIDANIWLSLYHFTSDDLEQFSKLKNLLNKDIKLFITEQVYNEVYRNREAKIKDALDRFKNFELSFPSFCKNYEEYEDFNSKYKNLKTNHKDWLAKIDKDIINQQLPADEVLSEFFSLELIIPCNSEIVDRGVLRYKMGNPPGKDRKYGDAISWECLLDKVPANEDLFFISADNDYTSTYDRKQFNPFLKREWEREKGSKIVFFKSLVEFLNKHHKEIHLVTEQKKDELIVGLENSPNFATTHSIISELSDYSDWNLQQIEDICNAAINNNQILWILGDDDVNVFYKKIISSIKIEENISESIIKVRDMLLQYDAEGSSASEDNEFPF